MTHVQVVPSWYSLIKGDYKKQPYQVHIYIFFEKQGVVKDILVSVVLYALEKYKYVLELESEKKCIYT